MEDVFHHCNTFSCHSSDSVAETNQSGEEILPWLLLYVVEHCQMQKLREIIIHAFKREHKRWQQKNASIMVVKICIIARLNDP